MNIFGFFTAKKTSAFDSKINKSIKVVEYGRRKVIYVDGAEQTGGTITGMWRKALEKLRNKISPEGECLLLGLGGGDVVRLLRDMNPGMKITAVELDPAMISIAAEYFKLKNSINLKIYRRDANYFILLNRRKFDLIIVDLFIGFRNPEKFRNLKFLNLLKKSLSKTGLIVYNSHYHSDLNTEFEEFSERCRSVFPRVEILINYPYSRILGMSGDRDNE